MGTDNPKVSAYVPQSLKERLKEFRKERDDISESQAVILILAEYFQMPEVLGRSPGVASVGGVTLARMETLEERLLNFTTLLEHRLQQLEQEIRNISGISVVPPVMVDVTTSTSGQIASSPSELQVTAGVIEQVEELSVVDQYLDQKFVSEGKESSLSSELLAEALIELKEADVVTVPQEVEEAVSRVDLALGSDQSTDEVIGNGQLELIEPALSNLLSEPLEELGLIPGIKLSKLRFGLSESRISAMRQKMLKQEMSLEEFTQWTKDKDPDDIPWKFIESPLKGYVPAEELSSGQKSSLLKWIKENLQ